MASEVKGASISGAAFVVGAVGGAVGNQLGAWDTWYWWVLFVVLTLAGAGLSIWLSYRNASGIAAGSGVVHDGDNRVDRVASKSGTATGINYGTITNPPNGP